MNATLLTISKNHLHLLNTSMPWKYRLYAKTRCFGTYIKVDVDAYDLKDSIKRLRTNLPRFSKRTYSLAIRNVPVRY